jgi:hypothetical protein
VAEALPDPGAVGLVGAAERHAEQWLSSQGYGLGGEALLGGVVNRVERLPAAGAEVGQVLPRDRGRRGWRRGGSSRR